MKRKDWRISSKIVTYLISPILYDHYNSSIKHARILERSILIKKKPSYLARVDLWYKDHFTNFPSTFASLWCISRPKHLVKLKYM
jgi:hypothetical protein